MISQEVRQEIDGLVRSGFYDKSRLVEIFCEEMYEPGELSEEEVANEIDLLSWQDLDRAVRGEGLFFAFGPMNPDEEETKSSVIGRIIQGSVGTRRVQS